MIQRYKFEHGHMLDDPSGYWVKYEDVERLETKLRALVAALPDTRALLIAREDALSELSK